MCLRFPSPRKGDLRVCDNWHSGRGWKVVATIIQAKLQKLAEEELLESQCSFWEGRGCSDMIFTIRQLVEKIFEHHQNNSLFS